ncbi:MAG: AbrB/MazE/SpoVT family DNA-binding domain-containing protein [Patescibacteria group bacterium]
MTTKIQKWGNSLAVRLPKEAAENAGLKQGSVVSIVSNDDLISIKPLSKPKETLSQLVRKISAKNRHEEIDWGKMKGKEVW